MDKNNDSTETTALNPKELAARPSAIRRILIGAATLGTLLITGWLGSGLVRAPAVEVGKTPCTSIQDCDAAWLNRKVERLNKSCYLGNIEILRAYEDATLRQYQTMATQWPDIYLGSDVAPSPQIIDDIKVMIWQEEGFFRGVVKQLSDTNELRSLANAQGLYLKQLKTLTSRINGLQSAIDRRKASPSAAPAPQLGPYSMVPSADGSSPPVPIIGKSGPFNVYAIEPKDDLDALKYFVGNAVYQPDELAKLLPVIEKSTASQYGLKCEYLCSDAQGSIVGRTRIHSDGGVPK